MTGCGTKQGIKSELFSILGQHCQWVVPFALHVRLPTSPPLSPRPHRDLSRRSSRRGGRPHNQLIHLQDCGPQSQIIHLHDWRPGRVSGRHPHNFQEHLGIHPQRNSLLPIQFSAFLRTTSEFLSHEATSEFLSREATSELLSRAVTVSVALASSELQLRFVAVAFGPL